MNLSRTNLEASVTGRRKLAARSGMAALVIVFIFLSVTQLPAANFVVRMQGTRFVPRDITITVGDSITWTNLDFSGHDAVSGTNGTPSGFWRTPLFGFGGSARVVFTNIPPRSYGYYCTPHVFAGMVGSVTVLAANAPPVVSILQPADGDRVPSGVPLTIQADPLDADGRVVRVDFFVDGTFLSSDNAGPFAATYANPPPGNHTLRVTAVDDRGATSAPVSVTITALLPPTILQPPQSVAVQENEPAIFSVIVTGAPPLQLQWQFNGSDIPGATNTVFNVAAASISDAGNYTVTVSNAVGFVTSPVASLTLNNLLPVVDRILTPTNGAEFPAGANVAVVAEASDPDGVIARVEFELDGVPQAAAFSSPWVGVITNVSAGNRLIRVIAVDDQGGRSTAAPSNSVTVIVFALPVVSLTQPASGQVFTGLTTITIRALATNQSGTITNFEFFANGLALGNVAPVTVGPDATAAFDWLPAGLGGYVVHVVATDRLGQRGASVTNSMLVFDPDDVTRPTLSLTGSPANFTRFTQTDRAGLQGTASDAVGLCHVEVFQMSQFTGELNLLTGADHWFALPNFLPGTRATNWQTAIILPPGQSTIQVRSVDLATNYSVVQARHYTFVVRTGILDLAVSPLAGGILTPGSRNDLEIGALYRLEAKATPHFIFAGWTNASGAGRPQPAFDLLMTGAESWTAYFVTNPWPQRVGDYTGLVTNQISPARDGNGLLTLKLTKNGRFTGRLRVDGESYSTKGLFDANGAARTAIIRPGRTPIALTLGVTGGPGGEFIHAEIVGETWTADATCYWNAFARGRPGAPQAGVRVFTNEVPRVILAANVSARGQVKLSGLLGDAIKLSGASTISRDGLIPFYLTPASGDALSGWLNLGPGASTAAPSPGQFIAAGTNAPVRLQMSPL